jgi:hypothetical protein
MFESKEVAARRVQDRLMGRNVLSEAKHARSVPSAPTVSVDTSCPVRLVSQHLSCFGPPQLQPSTLVRFKTYQEIDFCAAMPLVFSLSIVGFDASIIRAWYHQRTRIVLDNQGLSVHQLREFALNTWRGQIECQKVPVPAGEGDLQYSFLTRVIANRVPIVGYCAAPPGIHHNATRTTLYNPFRS